MNKRIRKKKMKQKYNEGVNHLSRYCELPSSIVIDEVESSLINIIRDLFSNHEFNTDFSVYLDTMSCYLMFKYKTGWVSRDRVE